MRTRLFHTIIACGATLGVAAACSSDGDDGSSKTEAGPHLDCVPVAVLKTAAGGAATAEGGLGGSDDGTTVGCGGWPPTK